MLKAPSKVSWMAKIPTIQPACPGLLVSYLLSDLPGIFTRDIVAAGLQSLR